MDPTCESGYSLDKYTCKCAPKRTTKKSANNSVSTKKKKRCPNGTRRNKKTGLCEPKSSELGSISKLATSMVENGEIKPNTPPQVVQEKIQQAIAKTAVARKSYSPNVNELLRTLTPSKSDNILGCGLEDILVRTPGSLTMKGDMKIKIGTDTNGKAICARWNSKKAQNVMLANLYPYYHGKTTPFDCKSVIAPMQSLSNCWFNTFFMSFFVSDKGRKFFRFFRELMIVGEFADGSPIQSTPIKKSLFLLNACIDCSLNPGWWGSVPQLGMLINTNNIIYSMYNSLPRIKNPVPRVSEWGNPLAYYQKIVFFLGRENKYKSFPIVVLASVEEYDFSKLVGKDLPEVIVCSFDDSPPAAKTGRKESFSIPSPVGEKIEYALDSVIVRDEQQRHFTSCLMCGNEQFIFDGASFGKLVPFKWKPLLRSGKSWRFKALKSAKRYNFTKCYGMFFYYRVTSVPPNV